MQLKILLYLPLKGCDLRNVLLHQIGAVLATKAGQGLYPLSNTPRPNATLDSCL